MGRGFGLCARLDLRLRELVLGGVGEFGGKGVGRKGRVGREAEGGGNQGKVGVT